MNKWIGKTLTAKQANQLPEGSTVERACAGGTFDYHTKRRGLWVVTANLGEEKNLDDYPGAEYKLIRCPDDNWEPKGEKTEWWARIGPRRMFGMVASLKHALDCVKDDPSNSIAILHFRDGVVELLGVDGKVVKNVGNQIGFLESERDRLADEVEELKKAGKRWADAILELSLLHNRWRAEAMAGRELLGRDGVGFAWAEGGGHHTEARTAYAAARAANEGKGDPDVMKHAYAQAMDRKAMAVVKGTPKPDGGPEALIFAKDCYGDAWGPYFSVGEMGAAGMEFVGHITFHRTGGFTWTAKEK